MRCLFFIAFLIISNCILFNTTSLAQPDVGKNVVSAELAGVGLVGSVNYERVFLPKEKSFLNARVGIGFTDLRQPSFVHGVTYCRGTSKHFVEAGLLGGLGTTAFGFADASTTNYYLAPMLGYRRHTKKGFLFKVYGCPLLPTTAGAPASFRLGIAFGLAF
jgi:hypothetical protein